MQPKMPEQSNTPPKMTYARLGNSGLKISRVILGCMSFGDPNWQPWILDSAKALPLLKHAYDRGINTFDVADTYSNGASEEILGQFLKTYHIPRSSVVILTKCFHHVDEERGPMNAAEFAINDGSRVNRVGLSRKHIFDAVERSVQRLGTYIDVLQTHRLDRDTPMEEIMKAFNDVIEGGSVRYIGGSSMAAWEFQMLQTTAAQHNWHKFISMQGLHNLLYREEEREMIPYCRATGVGLLPWSPLAAGVLTHAWSDRTDPREGSDVFLKVLFRGRADKADEEIVGRVQEVAGKRGVGMAQVALAWVLGKGGMMPICGLESVERIDQAVEAVQLVLTGEEIGFLEEPYLPKQVAGY